MKIIIDTDEANFGYAKPYEGGGTYIVAFTRDDSEDAPEYWDGDLLNDAAAIGQFDKELQEAYDAGHLAGTYKVLGRLYGHKFTTTEDALAERFSITVTSASGKDLTETLAQAENIDAWHPGMGPGNRAQQGKAIGTLHGLSKSEAVTALAQIIDTGREHGPTDDEAELLYGLIGPILERGQGFIATPDGWTIKVVSMAKVTA